MKHFFLKNKYIKLLLSFSLISITATILTPITLLTIRKIIIAEFGSKHGGYWDSINMISNNYFLFISMIMSLLILPEFSKATTRKEIYTIIKVLILKIFPVFTLGLVILWLFRHTLIQLLFSKDFLQTTQYIGIHFLGDTLKFIGWISGIFLIAKAQTKYYIIAEIISALSYIIFSLIFSYLFGYKGIFYAYITDNFIYSIIAIILAFRSGKHLLS